MAILGQSSAHFSPAIETPEPAVLAVFVVDASGHVVASNASAREIWRAKSRSLVTLPLGMLLGGGQIAADPDSLQDQWKALKAGSLDRWMRTTAFPFDAAPCEVRVRVERASGGAGSYIVTAQPVKELAV